MRGSWTTIISYCSSGVTLLITMNLLLYFLVLAKDEPDSLTTESNIISVPDVTDD